MGGCPELCEQQAALANAKAESVPASDDLELAHRHLPPTGEWTRVSHGRAFQEMVACAVMSVEPPLACFRSRPLSAAAARRPSPVGLALRFEFGLPPDELVSDEEGR